MVALQLLWMAIAPAQHLLSHATVEPGRTRDLAGEAQCTEDVRSRDTGRLPGVQEHAACAVCLVLAGGTCLPQAAPHFSVHSSGTPAALLLRADHLPKLQARGPPLA
jgi:hypothetical protein